jgi:hypothetical protein
MGQKVRILVRQIVRKLREATRTAVTLMAVGWYLRFSLSYRDVEELLIERRREFVTILCFLSPVCSPPAVPHTAGNGIIGGGNVFPATGY